MDGSYKCSGYWLYWLEREGRMGNGEWVNLLPSGGMVVRLELIR